MKPALVFFLLFLSLAVSADGAALPYADRPDVQAFIDEMAEEGFDRSDLYQLFGQARYQQSIIDAISRPAEKVLTWKQYQDIFLNKKRIDGGQAFIFEHRHAFVKAQNEYGVPATVIAAIIGVETLYGRIKGSYRVIDALATLAFDYPPRSPFFRSELKEFLYLAREEDQSPLTPVGSYAGAMGYGQFISSSYRHYAVDFDGDGVRDIWNNPVDAIGSVANYLARHGWQAGAPVTFKLPKPAREPQDLLNVSLKPTSTVAEIAQLGMALPEGLDQTEKATAMRLEGKSGPEYWLGMQNFYVITRYNHSKLYAMAVFQLSERLRAGLASPG